jgi:ankyrin repeat protein
VCGYKNMNTKLHEAAGRGDVVEVRSLIDSGVDIEAEDSDGLRPLHVAAQTGQVEAMLLLVELGADIEALTEDGETALELSVRLGCDQAAQELERSARTKKEAAPKKPTQQSISLIAGMVLNEEEEREEAAKRKVRDCSTLTLAELRGTRLDGVSIAHGLSAS